MADDEDLPPLVSADAAAPGSVETKLESQNQTQLDDDDVPPLVSGDAVAPASRTSPQSVSKRKSTKSSAKPKAKKSRKRDSDEDYSDEDAPKRGKKRPAEDSADAPKAKKAKNSGQAAPKKRSRKKKEGPKGASSSYVYFVQECRPRIVAANPGLDFREVGKALGAEWRALGAIEKRKYEDMAIEDRARYQRELAEWEKLHPPEEKKKGKAKSKSKGEEAGSDMEDDEDDNEGDEEKEEAEQIDLSLPPVTIQPKRPGTAYIMWMNATRPIIQQENPGANFAEMGKILGQRWKDLPADEKQTYQDKYDTAKKKYDADMKSFRRWERAMLDQKEREKQAEAAAERAKKAEIETAIAATMFGIALQSATPAVSVPDSASSSSNSTPTPMSVSVSSSPVSSPSAADTSSTKQKSRSIASLNANGPTRPRKPAQSPPLTPSEQSAAMEIDTDVKSTNGSTSSSSTSPSNVNANTSPVSNSTSKTSKSQSKGKSTMPKEDKLSIKYPKSDPVVPVYNGPPLSTGISLLQQAPMIRDEAPVDHEQLNNTEKLGIATLRTLCSSLKLSSDGSREELLARLKGWQMANADG